MTEKNIATVQLTVDIVIEAGTEVLHEVRHRMEETGLDITASEVLTVRSLEPHEQAYDDAQAYYDTKRRRYEVSGTSRQAGAIGIMEPFAVRVEAANDEGAREVARMKLYARGREHVLCQQVVELPSDRYPHEGGTFGQICP